MGIHTINVYPMETYEDLSRNSTQVSRSLAKSKNPGAVRKPHYSTCCYTVLGSHMIKFITNTINDVLGINDLSVLKCFLFSLTFLKAFTWET